MKTLSYAELIEVLSKPGATFVCIESLTDAKLLKTGNPLGQVFKKSRAVAMVGARYEASVNRQLEARNDTADFKADSLPWGAWLIPNKVITHKGEFYLRTQTTFGQRRVRPAKVRYVNAEGRFLSRETVAPFLPKASHSVKQEQAGAYGLAEKTQVEVRTTKFSNIMRLRLNGETVALKP